MNPVIGQVVPVGHSPYEALSNSIMAMFGSLSEFLLVGIGIFIGIWILRFSLNILLRMYDYPRYNSFKPVRTDYNPSEDRMLEKTSHQLFVEACEKAQKFGAATIKVHKPYIPRRHGR